MPLVVVPTPTPRPPTMVTSSPTLKSPDAAMDPVSSADPEVVVAMPMPIPPVT